MAEAGALRVQPISLEIPAPGQTGTVTLRNEGRWPVTVQARIFRWSQSGGAQDELTATRSVVASPPAVTLKPGADYVLRVVRSAKTPVGKEETYRLLVDELPDPKRMRNGAVALTVRQSIPVFFFSPTASQAKVSWSVRQENGRLVVQATNAGDRFLRVADLMVKNKAGATIAQQKGLAGYVLGNSTRTWVLPMRGKLTGEAVIAAATNAGRLDARAKTGGK